MVHPHTLSVDSSNSIVCVYDVLSHLAGKGNACQLSISKDELIPHYPYCTHGKKEHRHSACLRAGVLWLLP